jgi:hypothetical protein
MWFVNDANGMHYLKKTDSGFANIVNVNGTETVLANFEGDFFADYMLSGSYLIDRESLVVTNLLTGATQTFADINISDADAFYMNDEGTKAVFVKNGKTNANGTETWTADIDAHFLNRDNFEYAICYKVNGKEFWANNFGANYDFSYCIHH